MDNFRIDVTCEGIEPLRLAMVIAFNQKYSSKKATGYRVTKEHGLIFYSLNEISDAEKPIPLPFKLDAAGAADFAQRWLAEVEYGPEPGHDGSNGKGWRVYNENWGFVAGSHYAFVAVQPQWAWYGK